jgi:hypothetical protein
LASTAFRGVGVAAVAGIGVAIKAASDLGESLNKTRVIFGDASESVIAFSETTASTLGIAQSQALDAAAGFGAMALSAGLSESAAASLSIDLVKLAGDMASFNNQDPSEMLERLRSGLAGEAEPLRRFGVFLSEAAVQAKAMELGIGSASEELTDAEKVQARYAIILEQTTKQQGDFARTVGESLPNQLRVMKAELTDTAASLGNALLPLVLEATKALLELVETLEPLLNILGKLGPAVHLLGEAFQFLLSPLPKVIGLIQQGIQPTDEMVDVMGKAALRMQALNERAAEAAPAIDKTRKAVVEFANKSGKELEDWRRDVSESFDSAIFDLDNLGHTADITRKRFREAHQAMEDRAREMAKALREIAQEKWINEKYVAFLSDQGPEWLIGFTKLNDEQQRKAQDAWEATTKKTDAAKNSLDKITGVLDKMDKGQSRHTVQIHYEYVGFDPSKPGMSGSQQAR